MSAIDSDWVMRGALTCVVGLGIWIWNSLHKDIDALEKRLEMSEKAIHAIEKHNTKINTSLEHIPNTETVRRLIKEEIEALEERMDARMEDLSSQIEKLMDMLIKR